MSEEFEWVSSDSPRKEEKAKQTLPVPVIRKDHLSTLAKIALIIRALVAIGWAAFLWVAARLLLVLMRIRVPMPKLPARLANHSEKIWEKSERIRDKLRAVNITRPKWMKFPREALQWRPKELLVSAVTSGMSFIAVLFGLGGFFLRLENGGTYANLLMMMVGMFAALWLLWKRGFAAIAARWLLRLARNTNKRR